MGPLQIILIIAVILVFVIVIYKIWYQTGTDVTSLTVPDELIESVLSNVKTSSTMCNVTGVTNMVDMNGDDFINETLKCSNCTQYLSLQPSGSCQYLDYNSKEGTCEIVGEAVPCPFS